VDGSVDFITRLTASRSLFGPAKPCSSPRPCNQNPGMRAGRQRMAAPAATAAARRRAQPKGRARRASLIGRAHEGRIKVKEGQTYPCITSSRIAAGDRAAARAKRASFTALRQRAIIEYKKDQKSRR
jgi:hypothetical protein